MAGGTDVTESNLSCVKCGKPAHLQYVFIINFHIILIVLVYLN